MPYIPVVVTAAVLVIVAHTICVPVITDPPAVIQQEARDLFVGLVAEGVPDREMDGCLINLSKSRAVTLAEDEGLSHAGFNVSGCTDRRATELLVRNNSPDPVPLAISGLLESPPHRAILMDASYNLVGIGVAHRGSFTYFVLTFSR